MKYKKIKLIKNKKNNDWINAPNKIDKWLSKKKSGAKI